MAATGFLKQTFNFRVQLFTFTQHWSDFWSCFRTNDWSLKIYCNRKQSVAWAHSNVLPFVGWEPWWPAWRFPGWLQELHYCWGTEAAAGMSKHKQTFKYLAEAKMTNIWLHNYIPILKGIWSYSDSMNLTAGHLQSFKIKFKTFLLWTDFFPSPCLGWPYVSPIPYNLKCF